MCGQQHATDHPSASELPFLIQASVAPKAGKKNKVKKKLPGKFVCQTSVLLEVTKTCETARTLQPKHERGEGLGKEKKTFPCGSVVLLQDSG